MAKRFDKVVVIGLDGLEPKITDALMRAGQLPHLERLRSEGGYTRVATTFPAQTPVAWSTFATGLNPGGHGIFDFLRRDPQTYLPQLGLSTYEQKSAFLPPKAVNLRRGEPVWRRLTSAGIRSVILRCPCTYPPDKLRGSMLSGLGVPDLRGALGVPTFFTSQAGVQELESESVVRVQPDGAGNLTTHLLGPRDPKTGEPVQHELKIQVAADQIIIRTEGRPRELVVKHQCWSDWLKVKFKLGMLQSARGMVRFYLVRTQPEFELYASPINFDPDMPLFPISAFPEYASDLAKEIGTFYTAGMVEEHTGIINGRIDEEAFLKQCDDVWNEREAMLLHELGQLDKGLLYCLFDTPDRLQHIFWRFREPDHPANAAHPAADFAHVIDDEYRRCDRTVGKVLEFVDDRTLVIVLSDHGFTSFQRGMHLNSWLHAQGLLALESGTRPGHDAGDFFRHVDWSRTKAYALGLGGIYLNVQGREGQGIVSADEVSGLKSSIKQALAGIKDPQRGTTAVSSVVASEEVYHGACTADAPDLLVNFAAGYRASWETALGGVPEGHFEDNTRRWGGDHIVDPAEVPGVLFMNQTFDEHAPQLQDLAPTILAALAAPADPALEGKCLLE